MTASGCSAVHTSPRGTARFAGVLLTCAAATLSAVAAPPSTSSTSSTASTPHTRTRQAPVAAPEPGSPEAIAYANMQRQRLSLERDLKKIRAEYFRATRNTETRQVGLTKLRPYADDPAVYPTLLALFQDEQEDVTSTIFDLLAEKNTDDSKASLAWASIFFPDKAKRAAATKRLLTITTPDTVPNKVRSVVAIGLRSNDNDTLTASAQLAGALSLIDAIPMLISAQVSVGGGGGAGSGGAARDDSALAYILVGQQQAFVADLVPIVGDNAVAFDPRLGVITEGTILRVIDAVVITYRVDVHNALVALSTKAWGGQSTASLGWDNRLWRQWFANELVPYRRALAAQTPAQPAIASTSPPTTTSATDPAPMTKP